MNPLDPALEAAIRRAVQEAVGATVPYAHAGTVIGSLVAALIWTWLSKIPALEKKVESSQNDYLNFAKEFSPVLDRATDAIRGKANGT